MPETTAQYLSRLHTSIAISVDAAVIERRATAIDAFAAKATMAQALTSAAIAAGVAADLSKIQWLMQPVGDADPSFAPVIVDKAAAAVCSAMTSRLLAGRDARSVASALVALSVLAARGDESRVDDRLEATAQHRLWDVQRLPAAEAKYSAPALTVTPEQMKALEDALAGGNMPPVAAPLKAVVDALLATNAAQNEAIAQAIRALAVRQATVEEESRMQWWVVGRTSDDLLRPFADLPPFEAAARAAKELASMISSQRPAGPFAAPALLERALETGEKARHDPKPFSAAIAGIPLEARRTLFSNKPSTTIAPGAFPIMLGAEYSIESGDEPDWQPRFKRIAHVDANVEITPVEFAQQLYREFLLWKLLPA